MHARLALMSIILAVLPSNAAPAPPQRVQSQRDFETALAFVSSAPSYVMITVVDGRTGKERTDCTLATFLLGTIIRERHLTSAKGAIPEAQRIAGAARDHRFTFRAPAALRNLGWDQADSRRIEACRIIRSGGAAFMAAGPRA